MSLNKPNAIEWQRKKQHFHSKKQPYPIFSSPVLALFKVPTRKGRKKPDGLRQAPSRAIKEPDGDGGSNCHTGGKKGSHCAGF